jgi:hypothetical protein
MTTKFETAQEKYYTLEKEVINSVPQNFEYYILRLLLLIAYILLYKEK